MTTFADLEREDVRFLQGTGAPQVYCIVKGRRRHVPYVGWFEDEGWTSIPPRRNCGIG